MPKIETHFLVPTHEDASVGKGDLQPYYRWENLQRDLCTRFRGLDIKPPDFMRANIQTLRLGNQSTIRVGDTL